MTSTVSRCAVVLMIWLLSTSMVNSDQHTEPSLRIDRSVLVESVFQERTQQRLLNAAHELVKSREYSSAFDVLRELLRQPHDSVAPLPAKGTIGGIRTATLDLIRRLPIPVLRDWNQFCRGPASAARSRALRSGSHVSLNRISTEFPFSDVGADALITLIAWDLSARDTTAARHKLRQLKEWMSAGVLAPSQIRVIRRFDSVLSTTRSQPPSVPGTKSSVNKTVRQAKSAWTWTDNPWRHPQGPDELPRRSPGSHFDHAFGWQYPILSPVSVLIRIPAGVASLDRRTGKTQWFLPFRSVPWRPTREMTDPARMFDITPASQQQLEQHANVVYFIDGQRQSPVAPPSQFQSPVVLEQGATHLVALRTGPQPQVLWQVSGAFASGDYDHGFETPHFHYQFEYGDSSDSAGTSQRNVEAEKLTEHRLTGHLFLSSPRIHGDRLYVTTEHDGITWLNCLSAAHGTLTWQQPLTWQEAVYDESTRDVATIGAISDSAVICLFANGLVAGCHPADGHIVWIQSALFVGESEPTTSDYWLQTQSDSRFMPRGGVGGEYGSVWMAQTNGNVICGRRGSPGALCLDSATGEVKWTTQRHAHGTTVDQQPDLVCVGLTGGKLIVAGYGHCRAIDVHDGSQNWILPVGRHSGRICLDNDLIYVIQDSGSLLTVDAVDGSILATQQLPTLPEGPGLVMDGDGLIEASAWTVNAWTWEQTTAATVQDRVQGAFRELVAQSTAPDTDPPPNDAIQSGSGAGLSYLRSADLRADDVLKLAVLAPTSQSDHRLAQEELANRPDRLLQFLPGWRVSLRTAILRLQPDIGKPTTISPTEAILDPAILGPADVQLAAATQLVADGQRNEAELLLLNMNAELNSVETQERKQLLLKVRGNALTPGFMPTSSPGRVHADFRVELGMTAGFRLQDLAMSYRRFRPRTSAARVPSWSQTKFITEPGKALTIRLIDRARGIESAQAPPADTHFPSNVSYQDNWESPGLVPVVQGNQLGVISLLSETPLRPLWMQPVESDRESQVIAINSRQLLVSSNTGLQSFHPLTGETQWSRNWQDSEDLYYLSGQFPKLHASREHVILSSSLGTGYVALRADTGSVVKISSRSPGNLCRIAGEYALMITAGNTLQVTNLVTGLLIPTELDDELVLNVHPAEQLGRHKAMVITASSEFVILDLESGQATTRIPIKDADDHVMSSGPAPQLIRRSGLILASLSERNWRSPESAFGEPVTGGGVLICFDPKSGMERWQRRQRACVIPPIFGDPSPFVVLWTTRYEDRRPQFRYRDRNSGTALEITVLDAFTGEQVASTIQHMAARPLQVIYDRVERELRFTTEYSTIRMSHTDPP